MSLLEALWTNEPRNDKFIVAIIPREGKKPLAKQVRVRDVAHAQALAEGLSAQGVDTYFAPAAFQGNRTQEACASVPAFWIDLDAGPKKPYPDAAQALKALLGWVGASDVPQPTHIVRSGVGLHVYWVLDAPVPYEVWAPVARQFKQALRVGGVHADPQRTADAASILRIPGTRHYKDPGNPREVTLLHSSDRRVTLEAFAGALPALGPQGVASAPQERPTGEWAVDPMLPPGDAEAIAERCAQMRLVRDQRGAVEEPLWRAGLSVLKRCDNSQHYIHEWSKGDPRYSPEEAQAKADRTGGPMTCQSFEECNPSGCAGCPYRDKVTSPIQIQVKPPELPAELQQGGGYRVTQCNNFVITSGGVWHSPKSSQLDPTPEQTKVCDFPLWVVEVREQVRERDEDNVAAAILLEWVSLEGKVARRTMQQKDLVKLQSLMEWMADSGIAIGVYDWKLMAMYLSQLTAKNLKQNGTTRYYPALGWYKEGFVVGDRIIKQDAVEPAKVQAGLHVNKLSAAPAGSLERWTQAVNQLNDPKYYAHCFAVLAAFGSPLLELRGEGGATIVLAGSETGAGKTLATSIASSIWGQDHILRGSPHSTMNDFDISYTSCRHIPFVADETTTMPIHLLRDIVYRAANGDGRGGATRNGKQRERGTWRSINFMTTNTPLLDLSQSDLPPAPRARVLELIMRQKFDPKLGKTLAMAVQHDYGLACVPYMQAVIKHKERIPRLVDHAIQQLEDTHKITAQNRYIVWTMAAAKVGGAIAKALGLINFDIDAIMGYVAAETLQAIEQTQHIDERGKEVVNEFLSYNVQHINNWPAGLPSSYQLGDGFGVGSDTVRPMARIMGNGVIAVQTKFINEAFREAQLSKRSCSTLFEGVETKSVRLHSLTSPVSCYLFDMDKLGFNLPDPTNEGNSDEHRPHNTA